METSLNDVFVIKNKFDQLRKSTEHNDLTWALSNVDKSEKFTNLQKKLNSHWNEMARLTYEKSSAIENLINNSAESALSKQATAAVLRHNHHINGLGLPADLLDGSLYLTSLKIGNKKSWLSIRQWIDLSIKITKAPL